MLAGLDQQGWITLLAGFLLALITLFTSYEHVDLFTLTSIRLNQQVGVPLIAASLATLAGDVKLASRRRIRDQRDRIRAEEDRARAENAAVEERIRADRERNRAAEERERAARRARQADLRARRQDRCALAQLEFQLKPDDTTRQRLANLIALLREYGEMAG